MTLKNKTLVIAAGITTLACASTLNAQVLMLDFAATVVTGDARFNSPYHTESGDDSSAFWNGQGLSSDSTHKWADGTDATNVATKLFKSASSGSTSMISGGWSSSSSSINGSSINTGIYANNSAAVDGWMMSNTVTDNRAIGFQLSGLDAGVYDIYITGRNTNTTAAHTLNYSYATTNSQGNFNMASYNGASISFDEGTTDKTTAWVFDAEDPSASNYVKFTVTLTEENPYLNLVAWGDGVNGIFSSVQIVAVPEPSDFALAGGALSLLVVLALRRRNKR